MKKEILAGIKVLLLFTIITGLFYPLGITLIGSVFFSHKSEGSIIRINGRVAGSELIGQKSDTAIYFWSRPSATDYYTMPSAGSNLGRLNPVLDSLVRYRKTRFSELNQIHDASQIPSDIITASGSGLDPHISPEAARLQIARVSYARGFSKEKQDKLAALVEKMIEKRKFHLLGEPVVNVLRLNLKLDSI